VAPLMAMAKSWLLVESVGKIYPTDSTKIAIIIASYGRPSFSEYVPFDLLIHAVCECEIEVVHQGFARTG